MRLRITTKYQYGNGKNKRFYQCKQWPECRGTHGAHPNGTPMGTPASKILREYRQKMHELIDEVIPDRASQYAWLKKYGPKQHIGEMTIDDISRLYIALIELKSRERTI